MAYNRLIMTTYNWQKPDWPSFQYDLADLHKALLLIAEKTGSIAGKITHLAEAQQTEAMIDLMVDEAVKTSEIEGEYINQLDVRSSIRNQLGLNPKKAAVHDKRAQGIAELIIDNHNSFKQSLTQEKLFAWHTMLLPEIINPKLKIGGWRTHKEPMQVVSGRYGKIQVHFEAPPSEKVPKEMQRFITWFNNTAPNGKKEIQFAPVRAAIAHLYFESIHPFEDGNGRIGRAIAEKALSQGFNYPALLSLSLAIEKDRKSYYMALNFASKSNEITPWIEYFIDIILQAQNQTESQINFILKKALFFKQFEDKLSERQLKVIKRMMQSGESGFEGGMSAKKYMALTGISKATATRDLQELFQLNILKQLDGSGRNTRYELNL